MEITSIHEPHYDVLSAAVSGTAATMLTLLAMLGGSGANTVYLKNAFRVTTHHARTSLIVDISGIIRRRDSQKRTLSHFSAIFLIVGTVLVSLGASLPLA
ncbi:MAG: hypothetical protein ACREBS_08300 [Nitrososphaerales archaeon]